VNWTPAILGGEPAFPEGPPSWPPADEDVLAALKRAYRDGSWGRYDGPNLRALIEALATLTGVPHVLPTCSGTFAVELALRGVGVEAGDEVILCAYDFPGNFRAIEAIGAVPVVIDVGSAPPSIDDGQVADACGPRTKAVIASHLHGFSTSRIGMLRDVAEKRGLAIVEDACQCSGAIVQGRPAGTWGDVGTFSFGGSKLLTSGRGGAVFTARADVAQRMKIFGERGNAAFPLSELQAAVLLPQMNKLAGRRDVRRRAAGRIVEALKATPDLLPPRELKDDRNDYYKFGILLQYDEVLAGESAPPRDAFSVAARAEGIALDPGFRGFFRRGPKRCRQLGECSFARRVVERILVLHHPILLADDATLDRLAATLVRLAVAFREGTLTAADISTAVKFDGKS